MPIDSAPCEGPSRLRGLCRYRIGNDRETKTKRYTWLRSSSFGLVGSDRFCALRFQDRISADAKSFEELRKIIGRTIHSTSARRIGVRITRARRCEANGSIWGLNDLKLCHPRGSLPTVGVGHRKSLHFSNRKAGIVHC